MRKLNWEEVTDAGESNIMGAGGYVIKIVGVKDHDGEEDDKYIEVVYDIAEGDLKGNYATEIEDWKHQFRQYYNNSSTKKFRRFLSRLEENNPNFTVKAWQVNSDPKDFVGLNTGMVFRERRYLNKLGEAKWAVIADYPISIEDVRNGKFTIKEPSYKNTDEQEWTALRNNATTDNSEDDVYGSSIPF